MGAIRRLFVLGGVGLCLLAAAAPEAPADGLPSPVGGPPAPNVGPDGVTAPRSSSRFVTLALGRRTMVARIDRQGGKVTGTRLVNGAFTVPAVAYDGTPSGLSADGSTLVLIRPRATFPQRVTRLAVVDARNLRTREILNLQGDFSFDAISPDGDSLFLVQYVSPADPWRYAVRVYDMKAGRLLAAPIVDPQEAAEKMAGRPMTRRLSPDGRWAYTLYDGSGRRAPFIHALDTGGRTARCIELPRLAEPGVPPLATLGLKVEAGGRSLSVARRDGRALLTVDTGTFAVTTAAGAASPDRRFPLLLILVAAGLAGATAAAIRKVRTREPIPAPAGER